MHTSRFLRFGIPCLVLATGAAAGFSLLQPIKAVAARPCAACAVEERAPESQAGTATTALSDKVIVVEGRRDPGEASVSTAAMKFVPFEVPEGVTRITVHKEYDHGSDPGQKNTVDFGLFDSHGYAWGGAGMRGWQGGAAADFVLTGDPATSSTHAIPGRIPAGRWYIAQYFLKSAPSGLGYKYTVTLGFDGPRPPNKIASVPRYEPGVVKPGAGWYAGNLHSHTLHSDGGRTLVDMVSRNRDAGFDFVASTEHNSPTAHYHFPEAAAASPGMLLLYGDELTTPGGHANIVGQRPGHYFDFRTDPGDGRLPGLIREAHKQGAVFTVNHPFATCTSCTWKFEEKEWQQADAIEVWNGIWTPEDRQAVDLWDSLLKRGRRVWAYGGTDYHRGEDALIPAALVYADNLSRDAVMNGLRRGRVLLSEGPRGPRVQITPSDAPNRLPGDTVRVKGEQLPLAVRVTGGEPGMRVRLVWKEGEMTLPLSGAVAAGRETALNAVVPVTATKSYVRAELLKADGDAVAALTNPLFLEAK